jgi:5'-deoxy-5'-methylthioadenosine phosphorylase
MYGIIGGTGLTQLSSLDDVHREVIRTPYGEPSGPLTCGHINGIDVVFLARHGYGHSIPPHQVNYRANLWALKEKGVTEVVSVASVGGIRADMGPGCIVLPDQLIDYTWGRASTYFEGEKPVTHIDFTQPYTGVLRARILAAAKAAGQKAVDGGVYATTQGPRLETAAEINRFERDGADMVGMTGMPEAVLARELGLYYAAIAVVVNHAAGRADSREGIHMEAIEASLRETMGRVRLIIEALVKL